MAGILKSRVTTFEYDLSSMESLIAADLNVPVNTVNVTYVIQEVGAAPAADFPDRSPGTKAVTKIRVAVTNKD